MTEAAALRVESVGGDRVRIVQGAWVHLCAVGDLAKWAAFYAGLAARGGAPGKPGPLARFYAANAGVLAAAVRGVGR